MKVFFGVRNRPPRQETFLARYSRNKKLAITAVILAVLSSPWSVFPHFRDVPTEYIPKNEVEKVVSSVSETAVEHNPLTNAVRNFEVDSEDAKKAAAINDADDKNARMASVPDISLTENTAKGELPKISRDGRKVWQVYGRPFDYNDVRPRVAIIITDLGSSNVTTDAALRKMHANVTTAFDVQSPVVGAWLGRARQEGHEILLSIPMEPFDYPRSDPGPDTLLTNLPDNDNVQRLYQALRKGTGYVGIMTSTGSLFTTNAKKMRPIIEILKQRGLMVFDAGIAPHSVVRDVAVEMQVPHAVSTRQIDSSLAPDDISAALEQLEQNARLTGRAIGVASPLPATLDKLEDWIKRLPSRGIALAPVSAMVQ